MMGIVLENGEGIIDAKKNPKKAILCSYTLKRSRTRCFRRLRPLPVCVAKLSHDPLGRNIIIITLPAKLWGHFVHTYDTLSYGAEFGDENEMTLVTKHVYCRCIVSYDLSLCCCFLLHDIILLQRGAGERRVIGGVRVAHVSDALGSGRRRVHRFRPVVAVVVVVAHISDISDISVRQQRC